MCARSSDCAVGRSAITLWRSDGAARQADCSSEARPGPSKRRQPLRRPGRAEPMRRAAALRSSGGVGPAEPKFKRAKRSRVARWPGGAEFLLLCTSAVGNGPPKFGQAIPKLGAHPTWPVPKFSPTDLKGVRVRETGNSGAHSRRAPRPAGTLSVCGSAPPLACFLNGAVLH